MLADFACDPASFFDGVCISINRHDPTGFFGPLVERLVGPFAVLLVLYLAGRVLRRFVDAAMHTAKADPQVRALVHNVVTAVTYVVAVLSALVAAGVNIAVLLTVAGLGTVAIGLALQDLLRNLLAGIFLLLEHPFRIGDFITVSDQAGTVQGITLRTTTLHTPDGKLAILPNLMAFNNAVVNESSFSLRQFSLSIRLQGDTDVGRAMREARNVLDGVDTVARRPSPAVQPQLDGEATLLRCLYWVDQSLHDPDSVAADLAAKLWAVGRAPASQVRPSAGT
jgi:small-conductance mechanosensitive channel